ncbi:insulinase family protein [Candidatus Daviesbacteria bacterium]|nr:insulinase family protein [Candidatus Daviesbacteria bacterium]
MFKIKTLKNGLTLITIPIPSLESVTTLVAVGAGSRYEVKKINGISHFLEHMFFKGSKKYPTAEIISTTVDSIGAVNNAATSKEWTYYWIKSAAKHIELATDIISSMLKESLLNGEEAEREKGVIIEELRMFRDNPARLIWDLYENLQFGNQPLGWDIGGDEPTINSLKRDDFVSYVDSLYAPTNCVCVYAGKLPENIEDLAQKYFDDLPKRGEHKAVGYIPQKQSKPKVNVYFKKTDQANLILGVEGYNRYDNNRHAAKVLAAILGEGMSSRLFLQVRERRGLAYHVSSDSDSYIDTGMFVNYAGLKLEKVYEGLKIIIEELQKIVSKKVSEGELKKAKELIRGRLALRSESTNFLAEHFGTQFILDRKLESFEDYLKKIDRVTEEEVLETAKYLFDKNRFNLQVIAPIKDSKKFEKILNNASM